MESFAGTAPDTRADLVGPASPPPADDVLLVTRGVTRDYPLPRTARSLLTRAPRERLQAVRDVDVALRRGRTLGVVGETGSGKSTLGRLLLGLEKPTRGSVTYLGRDLRTGGRSAEQAFRRDVQVILQDPYTSLNPFRTVGQALGETLKVHGMRSPGERTARIVELLETVGLPAGWQDRLPGQLSGGGRQRVSIARALAVQPRILVADEPVSALDVSVQAQVLNLFAELQAQLGLAYLFITHDLAVLQRLADDVAVMYLGQVVEQGPAEQVLTEPAHPYTRALLAAAPVLGRRRSATPAATGEPPNPISPPTGCTFHTRCPTVMDICHTAYPEPRPAPGTAATQLVSCHLYSDTPPAHASDAVRLTQPVRSATTHEPRRFQ